MSAPELFRRWPLPGGDDLRDELLAAYTATQRGYHDASHLGEVLSRLDELSAHGTTFDEPTVQLAAWFHDSVYTGGPDDEERSARWADRRYPGSYPRRSSTRLRGSCGSPRPTVLQTTI